ncbi:MAG: cupin domain-containing protein [Acidobacteriota bacterium]|nr:cupin domain-containing protein [Acidobacteriota bacterium]
MSEHSGDDVDFDDRLTLALAREADGGEPAPEVRARLMARVRQHDVPPGFSFRLASEDDWLPHPVPGIRMKVLAMDRRRGIATLLLDVAPGTVFPAHHHGTDEECYVISGTLIACGRTIGSGDFHHADGGSDHGELRTDTGCCVLLVTEPEDYMPG